MDVVRSGLSDALSALLTFVPKLLGFLLILLVGWLIAKGLSKAIKFVLGRLGFNRLIERAGLGELMAGSQLDVGDIIAKIVYYFVLLIALQYAFTAFGPNPVEELLTTIITFLPRIIVGILLVVVAAAIARVLRDLVVSVLAGRQFGGLLGNITFGFVLALGGIAALNQVGIATTVTMPVLITALATIGGVLVVGVGGGLIRPMQQRWEGWLSSAERQISAPPANSAGAAPTAAERGPES